MVVKEVKKKTPPRRVPSRDARYMGIAFWWASFSKDPVTQIGSIIIDENNYPLGSGYNGPPRQYNDSEVDWSRPAKYDDVIHAEVNAINHCAERWKLKGSTIYVTGMPCKVCMLMIVAAGIKRVVYFDGKHYDANSLCGKSQRDESLEVARKGKVKVEEFKGNLNWMRDRIRWMESVGIFD